MTSFAPLLLSFYLIKAQIMPHLWLNSGNLANKRCFVKK